MVGHRENPTARYVDAKLIDLKGGFGIIDGTQWHHIRLSMTGATVAASALEQVIFGLPVNRHKNTSQHCVLTLATVPANNRG